MKFRRDSLADSMPAERYRWVLEEGARARA
jgi:hypothetical protein